VHYLQLAALVLVLIAGRGVYVYLKPYRECRWCRPGRRRRGARCWRCHGTRLTRRLGAWHAHKIRDSLQRAWQERGDG
jgi:hypothetical protein